MHTKWKCIKEWDLKKLCVWIRVQADGTFVHKFSLASWMNNFYRAIKCVCAVTTIKFHCQGKTKIFTRKYLDIQWVIEKQQNFSQNGLEFFSKNKFWRQCYSCKYLWFNSFKIKHRLMEERPQKVDIIIHYITYTSAFRLRLLIKTAVKS